MCKSKQSKIHAIEAHMKMPGHLLRRANQAVVAKFMEECRELGITPVQYAALAATASLGRVDATRLSALIGFDLATLGNVLDRLEQRGLVTRTQHPHDRRIKQLALTEIGMELLRKAEPRVKLSQERFAFALTNEELETLTVLLQKLISSNQASES